MNFHPVGVLLLASSAAVMAGCSINVRDDYTGERETSCAVTCPGKGRASVHCTASETPACSCLPTPTSTCVSPQTRGESASRHSTAVSSSGLGGATPL